MFSANIKIRFDYDEHILATEVKSFTIYSFTIYHFGSMTFGMGNYLIALKITHTKRRRTQIQWRQKKLPLSHKATKNH